ncbi:beta-lactamase transpeptidase [Fusarium albosuccineum]|uniref:Beta-lactamase transpeptidase n=1 Tax=Fusarium albosuccineum TaxID=1237068 RepID=A0A8H4PM19_9HYPO|nr:beta-lactamase transpeptidase [Fusarium albosuccineum]
MRISVESQQQIQKNLDDATRDQHKGVPGLVFVSIDRNGDTLAAHASGTKGLNSSDPMTLDTVFWIASCTKLITAIACMQLVEQGTLALDDAQLVYYFCPVLAEKKVLQHGELVPREGDITLRNLLSHTAGFGYPFFNKRLNDLKLAGVGDGVAPSEAAMVSMPLVNQPGSRWEYGINLDWAGILVERASGLKLNDYFQKYIFEPLGLEHIGMFPTPDMKQQIASMHQRSDGINSERDNPLRHALEARTSEERAAVFNSGGGGCFARPTDFVQILAALLNSGTSPTTSAQILKPETVDAMFQNQIQDFPDFGRQGAVTVRPEVTNSLSEMFPQEGSPPQGWGLSFFLTLEPGFTGRGANAATWGGLPNLHYWIDREKGVAGMIASQILPFGDSQVVAEWMKCEAAVYQGLGEEFV